MTIELFAHPIASCCQKVLVALYETRTPFTLRMLGPIPADLQALEAYRARPYRTLFPLGAPERD